MDTFYLKYIKYKSKYINLKNKFQQQDLYGGAEQNLVFNSVTGFIGYKDLAIGNPKKIGNKENILSMVDKSSALTFSYNTLTKNFEVETSGEYKGTILTIIIQKFIIYKHLIHPKIPKFTPPFLEKNNN